MRRLLLLFLLALGAVSCGGPAPSEPTATQTVPAATWTASPVPTAIVRSYRQGSWVRHTPFQWTHDGMPVTSEHFTIYSDSVTQEEKERFAEEAEKALTFVLQSMHITIDMLHFPPWPGKIEIFGSTRHRDELSGGWAYNGGFLFTYNQFEYREYQHERPGSFMLEPLFEHELTHVAGYLLVGYSVSNDLLVDTWFDEGLAVYVSQDDPYRISSLSQLNSLREQFASIPGGGNPILIGAWEDIPSQYLTNNTMMNKLYALFELAVHYLVDTYGVEKCSQVYMDVRNRMPFETAFMNQYGMSVEEYRESFFALMDDYLP